MNGFYSQNSGLLNWDIWNTSGGLSSNGLSDFWTDSTTLKVGVKGQAQNVKNLQFNLRLLGYTKAYLTTYPTSGGKRVVEKEMLIDGVFGPITEAVVKQFQINQKLNLAPSTMGMVGTVTKKALVNAIKQAFGSDAQPRYYDPNVNGVTPTVQPEVQTLPTVTITADREPPAGITPITASMFDPFDPNNKMMLYGGAAVVVLIAIGKMVRKSKT